MQSGMQLSAVLFSHGNLNLSGAEMAPTLVKYDDGPCLHSSRFIAWSDQRRCEKVTVHRLAAGCQDVKAELPSPPRAADVKHESSGQLLAVKGEEEQMKQLQLAAEGATLENFREKAYKYASSVMKLCGGPSEGVPFG